MLAAHSKRALNLNHPARKTEVTIPAGDVELAATWKVPDGAQGVVAFAHGSGSSRHSVRNQFVANVLYDAKLATLLLDLLTPPEEEHDRHTNSLRFDVAFLAARLGYGLQWCLGSADSGNLPIGLFGASTGAAAALVVAAHRPSDVRAVVSRGGRVDMAADALPAVQAPTLFVVGSNDRQVVELNGAAARRLRCEHEMVIIPKASHLFEEPGALEQVADLARDWFRRYLVGS